MWRRANSAWTGESSQVVMVPPAGSPAAIERAEYPPKVPISSTDLGPQAKVEQLEEPSSSRPTIIPGTSRVARRLAPPTAQR